MTVSDAEIQQLIDRLAVDDLLVRYATALDTNELDLLDQVFTPDAGIDYSAVGGPKGAPADLARYLAEDCFPLFTSWQHHITNKVVSIDGNTGVGRTSVYNPLATKTAEGTRVMHTGAWYEDEFIRTAEGWRIRSRTLGLSWIDSPPNPR